jgi:hypothetical protein
MNLCLAEAWVYGRSVLSKKMTVLEIQLLTQVTLFFPTTGHQ